MSTENIDLMIQQLGMRYQIQLEKETRSGFEGYIIPTDHLLEISQTLRDQFDYDYLYDFAAGIALYSWK